MSLRPITGADKPRLVDLLDQLSEESRYRRFFTRMRELSPAMLALYTEIDHCDREAIIAIESISGRALGVARYVRCSEDPEEAEIAVAVVDDWHRRGVASALLDELSRRARQEGVHRFLAIVQSGNRDALQLFHGLRKSKHIVAGPTVEFAIELRSGQGSAGQAGPHQNSAATWKSRSMT